MIAQCNPMNPRRRGSGNGDTALAHQRADVRLPAPRLQQRNDAHSMPPGARHRLWPRPRFARPEEQAALVLTYRDKAGHRPRRKPSNAPSANSPTSCPWPAASSPTNSKAHSSDGCGFSRHESGSACGSLTGLRPDRLEKRLGLRHHLTGCRRPAL